MRRPPPGSFETWRMPRPPAEAAAPAESVRRFGRYEAVDLLGRGGMGEVWRVRDPELGRTVALKILLPDRAEDWAEDLRFEEEARLGSQLQHPGVVPVYELGRTEDDRPYFTMQEIRGQTLKARILASHTAPGGPEAWPVRRLVDALHRVCETVAYAHSLGVIHRDLKPQNILLGAFGEVFVADWGLARQLSGAVPSAEGGALLHSLRGDAQLTTAGSLTGTPASMSPEQALGQLDRVGPPSDVYSLGAILFEILTGHPPFSGTVEQVLANVLAGKRRPWPSRAPATAELQEIADRAMALDPGARQAHAGVLAEDIARWLEGARSRERALALVAQAATGFAEAERSRTTAANARERAANLSASLSPRDPVSMKITAWQAEDEAVEAEGAARLAEAHAVQLLHSSLNLAPDLAEAHDRLADWYQGRQAEAEARRAPIDAAEAGMRLAEHDRGRYAAWRTGDGALTLVTDPPGAEAILYRYELRQRRLEPVFHSHLGLTPIIDRTLPMGSYRVTLRAPGCAEVLYPVHIGRCGRWSGAPPGETEPSPIWLPPEGALGPEEVYVPAGWFQAGGDRLSNTSLPAMKLWVDAFVMRRFELRNREYMVFLDELVDQGREAEALRHAPRERAVKQGEEGSLLYGRDAEGHFTQVIDDTGEVWTGDMPLLLVDLLSVGAFARWLSAREGRPWRAMGEFEYEKAARGVDGRALPWGDHMDPNWANMMDSKAVPQPSPVQDFPGDTSPYGVVGLAGNLMEWCADPWSEAPIRDGQRVRVPSMPRDLNEIVVARGGGYYAWPMSCRSAQRYRTSAGSRTQALGVRLVWSVPQP